ncbi:cysteine peptidase family C39 domain-containing protein [Mucilaginibacter psychrotolerans]|uniref:Peptidase C39-like domain-containing protein n=1 Tax=Mucilaginibacter psychrotolerans TaxID=1524096 RepID=A0A4Y8RXY0_9SPHI|nr:papain-like cysteine protease family protein [Mucilaginibacter psychrotolerans]TFF29737.1 hypothetical protein E2R66_27945 [Mucilaginibacter psychrotolerans]
MPNNKELKFTMQSQLQTHWCWAANATSISLFYDPASGWTQCKVADGTLIRTDCCTAPNPNPCDKDYYLDRALTTTGNFVPPIISAALIENDIKAEIDSGRVIGVRIGWASYGGHFVTVHGYNDTLGTFFVYVADPLYGKSFINLVNFTSSYQGSGSWTHTFYTKAPVSSMLKFTTINSQLLQKASDMRLSMLSAPFPTEPDQTSPDVHPKGLAAPHDVYIVTFNSLKNGDQPDIQKGGFRALDSENNELTIYDFSGSNSDAQIQQVIHDPQYNLNYRSVLNSVINRQQSDPIRYSLRILKQPELKIEAFWLHVKGHAKDDLFTPVVAPAILTSGVYYENDEFFKILENAAKARRVYDDNLLGG